MANIRPAQATLNEIRDGDLMNELAQAIHQATGATYAHDKKSVVTIELALTVPKNNKGMSDKFLVVSGDVRVKLAQADTQQTLFAQDEEGNLTRDLRGNKSSQQLPFSIAGSNKGNE